VTSRRIRARSKPAALFAAATAIVVTFAMPQPAAAQPAQTAAQPPAGAPAIVVDPTELESVQEPDQQRSYDLTIGNVGDAPLQWHAAEDGDEQLRRPVRPTTPVQPLPPEPGGSSSFIGFPGFGARPGWTVEPEFPPTPPGQFTLTHSTQQAIVAGSSVACAARPGVRTHATGYLRHFTLADFGVASGFDVSSVSFGVATMVGMPQQITVNLYQLADPDGPFVYDNLDLIGTAATTVSEQTMTAVQVPVTGTAPAGSTLVVEVAAPDMARAGFFLGAHPAGQSADSYLRAAACGVPEPAATDDLGVPGTQLLLNVTGSAELTACEVTDGAPWVTIDPTSGTVAPDGSQVVSVTFDSTGLADGDVRETNLCLDSNDAARGRVEVPLRLAVRLFPAIDVTPGSLHVEQRPEEVTERVLALGNGGEASLEWEIGRAEGACDTPGDVPWLEVAPASGTTGAGGVSEVAVSFDSTGLAEQDLSARLCVASNDPDRPLVEVPVTLAVRGPACDQVITGVHPGPLTVTEGVTCLEPDSRVEGQVNVLDGAGLVATAAVIQGALSTFGATVVQLTASQVVGPISIRGTTGSASMIGTQVVGSVLVVQNQPTDGPLVISANWIVGSLFCTGNQPPPVDGGTPNTVVGGMKLDQCAGL
jgi:hypothetical protein